MLGFGWGGSGAVLGVSLFEEGGGLGEEVSISVRDNDGGVVGSFKSGIEIMLVFGLEDGDLD